MQNEYSDISNPHEYDTGEKDQDYICLFMTSFSYKKLARKGNEKSSEASLTKTNPPFENNQI